MTWTLYKDLILDTLKSKGILATDSSGKVIEGTIASLIATAVSENETPTPATNGVQLIFTTANNYTAGTLKVYLDGLRQIKNVDYTETTSSTFTMAVAPDADEVLWVDYYKA